ncbi:hypothetical protein E2542_SST10945 [Spatholobus suberectus]|nr:hypothetical protein E2542_SST10945 [Spatholobus suberectus]
MMPTTPSLWYCSVSSSLYLLLTEPLSRLRHSTASFSPAIFSAQAPNSTNNHFIHNPRLAKGIKVLGCTVAKK